MKILLFGKNGQVGWELQRSLLPLGELIALDRNSSDFCGNLTDLKGITKTIQNIAPDIIVNAAAYTNVDKAEKEPDLAYAVNAKALDILANEAKLLNAWLVHYSTDYVFDGSNNKPYNETDTASPLSVYGKTKLAGEEFITASGCQHLIFRTSWVYATYGNNFINTMLRLGREQSSLRIVNDQIGAPTGAELLADITAHCIQKALQQPDVSGIYHLTASGYTSWYELAYLIFEHAKLTNLQLKIQPDNLIPIPSNEYATLAKRPLNSCLDTQKLQHTFNLCLPVWQVGVTRSLTEVINNRPSIL